MTRYQVEHIAGKRGGRTKCSCPMCTTLKTHGVCYKPDEICTTIRNPLSYYKTKARTLSGRGPKRGPNEGPDKTDDPAQIPGVLPEPCFQYKWATEDGRARVRIPSLQREIHGPPSRLQEHRVPTRRDPGPNAPTRLLLHRLLSGPDSSNGTERLARR